MKNAWLPKHKQSKISNNRHAKVDRKEDHKALTLHKELQVTKEFQSGRAGLIQGRVHQLISKSQIIILKNIQTRKSINQVQIIYA